MKITHVKNNMTVGKGILLVAFVLALAGMFLAAPAAFADHEGYDYAGYDGYTYGSDGYSYGGYDGYTYGNDGYSYGGYDASTYGSDGYSYAGYDGYTYGNDGYSYGGYDGYTYGNDGYSYGGYDGYTYGNDGYSYNDYCASCYSTPSYTYEPSYVSPTYTVPTYTVPTYTVPTYTVPPTTYVQPTYVPPTNTYVPPTYVPPTNTYVPPTYTQVLSVACVANKTSAAIGESVTWSAVVSGGTGSYTYSWSGTDGLSGNTQSINKSYSSAGSKTGSLVVNSGTNSRTVSCPNVVVQSQVVTPANLVVSCAGGALRGSQQTGTITTQVRPGETVTWNSQVSGGTGSYTYSWSGTDGLSGNAQSVNIAYSNPGIKFASVTVTSGNQTQAASCNSVVVEGQTATPVFPQPATSTNASFIITQTQTVIDNSINDSFNTNTNTNITYNNSFNGTGPGATQQNLTISCGVAPTTANINETVSWSANASGGSGSYTYSWSGTDGLSGNNQTINRSYNTTGTKFGSVTVTSGGQSQTASCNNSLFVNQTQGTNSLNASCYIASGSQNVNTGSNVTWGATVSGGNGFYTYFWSGTDNLSGNSQLVSRTYTTGGQKNAQVIITSGNESISRSCPIVTVNQNAVASNVTVSRTPGSAPLSSAVYLSQVPYTGLSLGWKLSLFTSFLIIVSGFVAYRAVKGQSLLDMVHFAQEAENAEEAITESARKNKILLSQDGIDYLVEVSRKEGKSAGDVFNTAVSSMAVEGEWTAVTREKLSQALYA